MRAGERAAVLHAKRQLESYGRRDAFYLPSSGRTDCRPAACRQTDRPTERTNGGDLERAAFVRWTSVNRRACRSLRARIYNVSFRKRSRTGRGQMDVSLQSLWLKHVCGSMFTTDKMFIGYALNIHIETAKNYITSPNTETTECCTNCISISAWAYFILYSETQGRKRCFAPQGTVRTHFPS